MLVQDGYFRRSSSAYQLAAITRDVAAAYETRPHTHHRWAGTTLTEFYGTLATKCTWLRWDHSNNWIKESTEFKSLQLVGGRAHFQFRLLEELRAVDFH